MKARKYIKTIVFIISLLLTACGSNANIKNLAAADPGMAIIKGIPGWNPLSVITVQLYRLDGKKVSSQYNRFEVLPGEHELKVRCRRESPEAIESAEAIERYYTFKINLKAGHEYKPKLDMTRDCYLQYIDANTGKSFQPLNEE
ncbi:MAG: hypothetical protein OEY11_14020 [Gammaproteobacteria bacterium]|nr:hypothetical protein [Gammaproteobacteria bacterium]